MLLSSEPLGSRFARRAAFHRRWGVAALVAAIAINVLTAPVIARCLLGKTVDARVTQLREYKDRDHNDHFQVTLMGANGFTFSDEVSSFAFSFLKEGDAIQVRYVPVWKAATVIEPNARPDNRGYLAVPLLGILALVYRSRSRSTRPWYDRKLVAQGSGRLADGESAAQEAPKRPEGRRRKPATG